MRVIILSVFWSVALLIVLSAFGVVLQVLVALTPPSRVGWRLVNADWSDRNLLVMTHPGNTDYPVSIALARGIGPVIIRETSDRVTLTTVFESPSAPFRVSRSTHTAVTVAGKPVVTSTRTIVSLRPIYLLAWLIFLYLSLLVFAVNRKSLGTVVLGLASLLDRIFKPAERRGFPVGSKADKPAMLGDEGDLKN